MSEPQFSILVVCTANICRSPAGQALLAQQLDGHGARVESAGTRALHGNPIDATMARLLQSRGNGAMPEHRSRPVMPTMLGHYQLVLCMQEQHLQQVLALYPQGRGKVRLLGHWSQQQIADPVGQADPVYATALDQIEVCTAQWAKKLIDMGLTR
ncbi:MAG: low molecular weight protein-tyrosine-phosphatase [Rhodoferax sp.]